MTSNATLPSSSRQKPWEFWQIIRGTEERWFLVFTSILEIAREIVIGDSRILNIVEIRIRYVSIGGKDQLVENELVHELRVFAIKFLLNDL